MGSDAAHPASGQVEADATGRLDQVEEILRSNRYAVLATATTDGIPWVTPVYFAHAEPTTLWWVSRPEARHSCNLAANPSVALTVFDSSVPLGGASAVYAEARAQECSRELIPDGIATFSRCSQRDGGDAWDLARVTRPAPLRLYWARVTSLFLLPNEDGPERRYLVPLPTVETPHQQLTDNERSPS